MSTTTISFTWKVNGSLTDVTTAKLSDPTGTFGVKRTDTGAAVVADGTDLSRVTTGTYSYTFTDPAANLDYNYYVEVVYNGQTYHVEKNISGGAGTSQPSGNYCDRDDLDTIAGAGNVSKWADRDNENDSTVIADAIQQAIDLSEARIDGYFRDGPYTVPFSPVPTEVRWWAAKLAVVELYQARGQRDEGDETGGKFADMERDVHAQMNPYVCGDRRLQEATTHSGPTAPVVVTRDTIVRSRHR